MKILWHMPAIYEHGDGLSMRAYALAGELARRGHAITFCAPADRNFVKGAFVRGFPIAALRSAEESKPLHWCLQGLSRARAARTLVSRLDAPHDLFISCQPEVISAYRRRNAQTPVLFVSGSSTLLFDGADRADQRRLSRMKQVCYAVDRGIKHRNEAAAYRAADRVIFDSHQTRERVSQTYGIFDGSFHSIVGGVDPREFVPPMPAQRQAARARLGIADDAIVVMGTGRLVERKGFAILIAALKRLDRRFFGVIVGDGPQRVELQRLASAEPQGVSIQFPGMTGDVQSWLHAADIYAFTSQCESFGAALVEAMACGLPCVGLRPDGERVVNANTEIMEDGVSGVLCDPDAVSLSTAISQLANDPALQQRIGDAAVQRVRDRFTWARAGVGMAALIESMDRSAVVPKAVMAFQG